MRKKHRIILIFVVGTFLAILVWATTAPNKAGEEYEITWSDKVRWEVDDLMVKLNLRRPKCSMNSCIANLKQIDGAKATWALENNKTTNDIPTASELYGMTAYIRDRPMCPHGGAYSIRSLGDKPTCTIPGHTL